MSEPATTPPAEPVSAPEAPQTEPAPVQSEPTDKTEARKAFDASQMAMRKLRDSEVAIKTLTDEVTALRSQLAKPAAPEPKPKPDAMPAGVEGRLQELEGKLEASEAMRAKEKLDAEILGAATKQGVDPQRVDYLTYKLKNEHGDALTHEGVPDPMTDGAKMSVPTLISSLLKTPDGAVFKAAPQTATLPTQSTDSPAPQTKTMKRAEFDAMARDPQQRDAYKATIADMKAGNLQLED